MRNFTRTAFGTVLMFFSGYLHARAAKLDQEAAKLQDDAKARREFGSTTMLHATKLLSQASEPAAPAAAEDVQH